METTEPTKYKHINDLLKDLLLNIKTVLNDKLVGLYLYGSLVIGDFDVDISDIDILAATTKDINEIELSDLEQMHNDFSNKYREWNNRIEVQYFSISALGSFKTKVNKMANISPGEPLHIIDSGIDWLMNWYFVQENGVVLFGSQPDFISPISKKEFLNSVKVQAMK